MDSKTSKISASSRQRKAAYKAWKTMRRGRLLKGAEPIESIEKFMPITQISGLTHPEAEASSETKYARGIISLFNKTPPDIACGRFWELRWAYGCPLDCNYCYLRGTMKGNMKPSPLRPEHILNAIDEAFANITQPSVFNTGELSDSLMYPALMKTIVDRFELQDIHKVALLSKMGKHNIQFLLEKPRRQTICSWSINADIVAKRWEKAAAPPKERIDCAKMVSDLGYDTRIRLDPVFPVYEWKKHYREIIDYLFSKLVPDRIILGTPRGLWKTIKYAKKVGVDMSWSNYFGEDSGWGQKLKLDQRKQIYRFLYNELQDKNYPTSKISLCKETLSVWKYLGLDYKPLTCNCYGPDSLS